jgi:hypothetical protein
MSGTKNSRQSAGGVAWYVVDKLLALDGATGTAQDGHPRVLHLPAFLSESFFIVRAERRLGEMMAAQPKAEGTRGQLIGRGLIGGSRADPPNDA